MTFSVRFESGAAVLKYDKEYLESALADVGITPSASYQPKLADLHSFGRIICERTGQAVPAFGDTDFNVPLNEYAVDRSATNWEMKIAPESRFIDEFNAFLEWMQPIAAGNPVGLVGHLNNLIMNDHVRRSESESGRTYDCVATAGTAIIRTDARAEIHTMLNLHQSSLVIGDGAGKVTISLSSSRGQFSDDPVSATKKFVSMLSTIRNGYDAKVRQMEENVDRRIRDVEEKSFLAGMQALTDARGAGWEVVDKAPKLSGTHFLHYPGRIYATEILTKEGDVFSLPEDLREVLYVEDIYVHISGGKLSSAVCKGVSPHRTSDDYGADCDEYKSLCIGDHVGKPVASIRSMTDSYRTVNLHSAYGNPATQVIYWLFGKEISRYADSHGEKPAKAFLEPEDGRNRWKALYKGSALEPIVADRCYGVLKRADPGDTGEIFNAGEVFG